ncbi:MAG: hypothetical protein ABR906_03525 [Terracidiphilus sp.]|jgi:hypothetical protein
MKIEEAIQKAIKGGYDSKSLRFTMDGKLAVVAMNINRIFLDPSFWQSLGKALSWQTDVPIFYEFPKKIMLVHG